MRMEQMYQDVILDHYKHPHGRGLREPFGAEVHHVNPTCGDEVTLRVALSDDGNTVTGMWNYAQNFAMNDNSYSTIFGPSTPGALNLISGTVAGGTMHDPATGEQKKIEPGKNHALAGVSEDGKTATVVGDPDPLYDDCSNNSSAGTNQVTAMHSKNIGDQLNDKDVT